MSTPEPAQSPAAGAPHAHREHFIPVALHEVERLVRDRARAERPEEATDLAQAAHLLSLLLRRETDAQADGLKRLYQRVRDADDGQIRRLDASTDEALRERGIAELAELLERVLLRANYRLLSRADLEAAFAAEAIAQVRTETDLDEFAVLRLFTRGRHRRTETLRTMWGLRKRTIEMDVFDRVFLFAHLPPPPPGVRRRGRPVMTPRAPLQIKLARSIPAADLEMLLPNSRIAMRPLDQAFVVVPAVVSVVGIASKVLLSLTAMFAMVKFWVGLEQNRPEVSGGWAVVFAGALGLLSIAGGAWTKYQNRRLRYLSSYSETLYFQTLDNEAGAFLRVLDEAYEEDAKEAMLAYAFLCDGPADEPALDARIESWLGAHIGTDFDFEVDDALRKLERLGVARLQDGRWHALAPARARDLLLRRWSDSALS